MEIPIASQKSSEIDQGTFDMVYLKFLVTNGLIRSTELLHPNTKEYTFYSATHGLFFNRLNSVKKRYFKNFKKERFKWSFVSSLITMQYNLN